MCAYLKSSYRNLGECCFRNRTKRCTLIYSNYINVINGNLDNEPIFKPNIVIDTCLCTIRWYIICVIFTLFLNSIDSHRMLELSYYNNYGKSDQDNFKQRITFDVKADLTTMKYKHKDSNGTAVF